jgi:hypothetical protein
MYIVLVVSSRINGRRLDFWCSCIVIVSQKDVVELFDLDVNFGI